MVVFIISETYPNGTFPDHLGNTRLREGLHDGHQMIREEMIVYHSYNDQQTDQLDLDHVDIKIDCRSQWFPIQNVTQFGFAAMPIGVSASVQASRPKAYWRGDTGSLRMDVEFQHIPPVSL